MTRLCLIVPPLCAAIMWFLTGPAHADFVLFSGEAQQGTPWSDNPATTAIIDNTPLGQPDNQPTLRLTYDRAYRSAGLGFYGTHKLTVPPGFTTLRLKVMSPTHDVGFGQVRLALGEHQLAFDSNRGAWTLDGEPGNNNDLRKGQWHTLELDVSQALPLVQGGQRLKGHLAFVSPRQAEGLALHLADARLINTQNTKQPPAETINPPETPQDASPTRTANPHDPKPRSAPPILDAQPSPHIRSNATPDPVILTIHPKPLQAITQWGIVTHNRPDWGKAWDITRHPASIEALYKELGVTLVRFHIDYRTYDSPRARQELRDAVLAVTNAGLDWYGVPWSPPAHFKTLDTVNGRLKGEINHLKPGYEDDVAAWLVDLLTWLEAEGVPRPIIISPQNEPDWPPPSYPGCIYSPEQIRTAIIELRKQLDAAGFQDVRVGGDEGGASVSHTSKFGHPTGTVNLLGLAPGGAYHTEDAFRDALSIVTTHTYDIHNGASQRQPGHLQEWHDIFKPLDVELWMTEWQVRHEHTFDDWGVLTEMFNHFNRDISSMGFNGWVHWHSWKGWTLPEDTPDTGEVVGRIRAGDTLTYDAFDFGDRPAWIDLRVASNSRNMTVSLHLDQPDAAPVATADLKPTQAGQYRTHRLELPDVAGPHTLHIKFTSPEPWREAALNWLQVEGQPVVEAEHYTTKQTTERWSSKAQPAFHAQSRAIWVHDDGQTLQRRPTYYVFQKLWNAAPAGPDGKTTVRRVSSSNNQAIQGESKAADLASHRQDLCAFVHGDSTVLLLLNRNDAAQPVTINGLTGSAAELSGYTAQDAGSINTPMHNLGRLPIKDGQLNGLILPPTSLSILITHH
ncbi:MAG: carbohydrate-binding protein [Planctomycetota bacterium]